MLSPQAVLPGFRVLQDYVKDITNAKPANIDVPRVLSVIANTPLTVFDARAGLGNSAWKDRKLVSKLTLHNLGTNPLYFAINTDCTSLVFHDVLAGGNAVEDGLGSLVDLGRDQPDFISVYSKSTGEVAVFISYPLDTCLSKP